MNQKPRIGRDFLRPILFAKTRMMIGLLAISGDQQKRKALANFRSRRFGRWQNEIGQRIEAKCSQLLGIQFDFAAFRGKWALRKISYAAWELGEAASAQFLHINAASAKEEFDEYALRPPAEEVFRYRVPLLHALEQADGDIEIATRFAARRHRRIGVGHGSTRREFHVLLFDAGRLRQ